MKCLLLWLFFGFLSQAACACVPSGWFDASPFTIWQDRLVYHDLKQLCVTEGAIDSAIYDYGKFSIRHRSFFSKVLEGKDIDMIVIGGSNSAGGGIPNHRQLYYQLFLQWWNHVILPCTGSKLTVENLSLGGTGSDFFNLCLQNYLLDGNKTDLVLIELSVNDYGSLYGRSAEPMELLTRRVLELPSKPLVMYITLVDLIEKVKWRKSIPNPRCLNLEDLGQHDIARYYNITVLSWRDIVCPVHAKGSKRKIEIRPGMVNEDHFHIGPKSHVHIALMLIRYTEKALQKLLEHPLKTKKSIVESISDIAPLFVNITSQSKPFCWSLISKNWRKPGLTQSLNVRVLRHKGFREITPQNPYAKKTHAGDRSDSFGGWQSNKGESFIEFSFTIPEMKEDINKWSVGLVLRHLQNGNINVCLDDNKTDNTTITGENYGRVGLQTRLYFLGGILGPGSKHKMLVKTKAGKGEYKVTVSGIVLCPAGMKNIKEYKPSDTIQKVWSSEDYDKLRINSTKNRLKP